MDDLSGWIFFVYCLVDLSEFFLKSINGIDSLFIKGYLVEVFSRIDGYFFYWLLDMGLNVYDDILDNLEMYELLMYM